MSPFAARTYGTGRAHRATWLLVGSAIVVLITVAGVQLTRGVPAPEVVTVLPASLKEVPDPASGSLPWPRAGAAALVVPGVVSFTRSGSTAALPIASIAKVMTVLVLLHDHPLALGQQGPSIPITAAEVAQYTADQAAGDSDVPVSAGEQLSEYQAIEAMLVASADNVAQLVAQWDAGSEAPFVAEMNNMAALWGLGSTHFADVSGLAAGSVSTTSNLLALGERAMANPVVRSVVSLPTVTLPDSPQPVPTYDFALDEEGIVGIKTGSDPAAGGCFLFAAQVNVRGTTRLAYGVVLGQQSRTSELDKALGIAVGLLKGLHRVLSGVTILDRGQRVGRLVVPWAPAVSLVAGKTVSVVAAPGAGVRIEQKRERFGSAVPAGTTVGQLLIRVGNTVDRVPVVTAGTLHGPSIAWRLTHL